MLYFCKKWVQLQQLCWFCWQGHVTWRVGRASAWRRLNHQGNECNAAPTASTNGWFYTDKDAMTRKQKQEIQQITAAARVRMAKTISEIEDSFLTWAGQQENAALGAKFKEYVGDNTST